MEMVSNIAQLVVTFGGSAAVKTAQGALRASFKIAKEFINKKLSKAAYQKFMKSQAQKVRQQVSQTTTAKLFDQALRAGDLAMDIAAGMDPIGIVAVVQSFIYEIC